jgi:hypothetical protein
MPGSGAMGMKPVIIILVLISLIVFALLVLSKRSTSPDSAASAELEAQRFAKLLIAEIKLYNAGQIEEGRKHKDLYRRLKKDIERAKGMYDKRVGEGVAEREDYFHAELVRVIAEGDATALGVDYRRD